ncbi:MAG: inositol monophosphatase [Oscillospiraceae bacterium]|nr:inositol monophosphatase [Oscillospiraceae bacterium]
MCKDYTEERIFITEVLQSAFDKFYYETDRRKIKKGEFDIVTPLDLAVEEFILENIRSTYPDDMILSEENLSDTNAFERTWTVDPIDGTFNMADNSPLFGMQCALIVENEPVVSVIYLPLLNELYYAQRGCGAFRDEKRIRVNSSADPESSIVSFADYSHICPEDAELQHRMIGHLMPRIAKIRMFGAASIDFSFAAGARTMGTVLFTKNKWDLVPGILLCREAGAIVMGNGGNYTWDSNFVIAAANEVICDEILSSMN